MNIVEKSVDGRISDMEIALFYMAHIDRPCVDRQTGHNLRDFYIRGAKEILPRLTNPFAKEALEIKIGEYEDRTLNGG